MSAYVLSQAGLKVLLLEAGPLYDPAKNVTQLKCPTNHLAGGARKNTKHRNFGDFDAAMADGNWMVNRTPTRTEQNLIGFARACWAAARITGEDFIALRPQRLQA